MAGERQKLQKELAAYLADQDRARLRLLRAQINAARVERRHLLAGARTQCREARGSLKEKQARERHDLVERQRLERAEERAACLSGVERAKVEGTAAERSAFTEYAEARALRRQLARTERKRSKQRTTKRERITEDDDEVRNNLPPELVPVFNLIAKKIKAGPRHSRTEAFLEWAEAHPEEIYAVQQVEADRKFQELLKEQREHGRAMRKAGRYKQSPEKLRELLAAVPF
jgi:hypothetical protein